MQASYALNSGEQPSSSSSPPSTLTPISLLEKTIDTVVVSFIKTQSGEIHGVLPQQGNTPSRVIPVTGIPSSSLENLEAVKDLIRKSRFTIHPDHLSIHLALKKGLLVTAPQAPLQPSPLGRKSVQGFAVALDPLHPYRQKHPKWCQNVENGFSDASYAGLIKQCKVEMGILEAHEELTHPQRSFVEQIKRSMKSLLDKLNQPQHPSLQDMQRLIRAICENTYKFIFSPVWEIEAYHQSSLHIFIQNQIAFRKALEEEFSSFNEGSNQILDQILKAIQTNKIDKVCVELEINYPEQRNIIQCLKIKSKALVEAEQQRVRREIDQYLNKPQTQACLENIIYQECPHMKNYRLSLTEIPSAPYCTSLPPDFYVDKLSAFLKAWQDFQTSPRNESDWAQFKAALESVYNDKNIEHFQKVVTPLIQFWQSIENILLWPQEYLISEKEEDYLIRNLYIFMGISNTSLAQTTLIPYDYQNIPEQKLKHAEATLKSPKSSFEQKREACRLLLHAQIPWKDLCAIGGMLHRSGSVTEKTAKQNRSLVCQALPDLILDLPRLKKALEALIEFELKECSKPPFYEIPQKSSEDDYSFIHILGASSILQRNFEKLQLTLHFWTNQQLSGNAYAQPKIKYAILRTIQIMGELFKNLRSAYALSEDEIWDCVEDLRDLLAHVERSRIQKRLTTLIQDQSPFASKVFAGLFDNLRSLREHFQSESSISRNNQTWADIKQRYSTASQHKTYLLLEELQNFYLYLAEKIPEVKQEELRKTVKSAKAQQTRREIIEIQQALLQGNYQNIDLAKLPLTQNQQTKLKECLKVLQSPKAAENNAIQAKPANLTKLINIFKSLSVNKFSEENKTHIEMIQKMLTLKNYEKDDLEAISSADLLKDPTFKTRIQHIQALFQKLRKEWPNQNQIESVEDFFISFIESAEDFVLRKKEEFHSILESVEIVQEEQVDTQVEQLIRSLQLSPISSQILKMTIKTLGITEKSDEILWENVRKICSKEDVSSPTSAAQDENQTAKKKALKSIEAITDKTQALKDLLPSNLQSEQALDTYRKDSLLQLGSQYLISAFRSAASSLELAIEMFRHDYPDQQFFFQDIQHHLVILIQHGNDILHVHDVSEPDTRTTVGRIFSDYGNLQRLLQNLDLASNSNRQLPSLIQKLTFLKHLVES